ncbi:MAG: hypothetical protein WCJ97_12040 [Phycisphaerae bacterium]
MRIVINLRAIRDRWEAVRDWFVDTFSNFQWRVELTRSHIVQLCVAVVLLIVAVSIFVYNWDTVTGHSQDSTITVWSQTRTFGTDPRQPISPQNLENPQRRQLATVWAGYDGQLTLFEYPIQPEHMPHFGFSADRRPEFRYWHDVMGAGVAAATPAQRILIRLGLNLQNHGENFWKRWVESVGFTAEQRPIEQAAREELQTALTKLDQEVYRGEFETRTYRQIMDLIETYRAIEAPLPQNKRKQELAEQIYRKGIAYYMLLQQQRWDIVTKYMQTVSALMDSKQQEQLIQWQQDWNQNAATNPKRKPTDPPRAPRIN